MALIDIDTYGSIASGDPYRLPYNFNQPAAPDDTTYIPNSPPPAGPMDFNPFTLQPDQFYQQPAPEPQTYSPFTLDPFTLQPDAGYSEPQQYSQPPASVQPYGFDNPWDVNYVPTDPNVTYGLDINAPMPYTQTYQQDYYGADTAQPLEKERTVWLSPQSYDFPDAPPPMQLEDENGGYNILDALNLFRAPVEYATGPAAAAVFGGAMDNPLGYAAAYGLGGIPGLVSKAAYDAGKGLITDYSGNKQAYEDFQQNEDVPWAVRTGVDIGLNPLTYATPALSKAGVLEDLSPLARLLVDQGSPIQQLGAGLGGEAAVRYGENVPYFGDQPKWLQGLEGGALGMLSPAALEHAPGLFKAAGESLDNGILNDVVTGEQGSLQLGPSPQALTKGATVIDDTGKEWEVARRFTGDENGKVRVKDPETGETAAVERSRLSEPGALETSPVAPIEARGAAESAGVSSPPAAPPPTDILHLPALQPEPLSSPDRLMNALKRTIGVGTEEDTIATPAMRERERLKPVVNAQASRLSAVTDTLVHDAFKPDGKGRIQSLPGAPTIQDVAARLPEFEPYMTAEQRTAIARLKAEVEPYGELLKSVGVEYGSRADVMDGGFYLPRGRADVEGADAAVKVRSGRGGAGGKKGFERGATFDSMAQGIDAGYEYAPFSEAMASYGKDAGSRAVDQHIANYFKNLVDEEGVRIGKTPADRVPDALKGQYEDAVGRLASIRARLKTAERRAGMATRMSDELDKAFDEFGRATPVNSGELAKLGTLTRAQARRGAALTEDALGDAGRIENGPFTSAEAANEAAQRNVGLGKGLGISSVVAKYDKLIPPDVDRIRHLDVALGRTIKRVYQLANRGGDYRATATRLRHELASVKRTLDEVGPAYQQAVEKARMTPRDQGSIGFAQLNGTTFPDEVANAANKYLNAERPPSGKGAIFMHTSDALNSLLRGLRASADVSFSGIQGLLGAGRDPVGYGKAMGVAVKSMGTERALGAKILAFDEAAMKAGKPTSREWIANGLHVAGADTEFQVGRGISGKVGSAIRNAPIIKQSNRAFGYFGDTLRLEVADTMLTASRARNPEAMKEIANIANLSTGWSPRVFAGDVGQALQFAPRFFQSQLELVGKAVADGGIEGNEARRMLITLMGAGTLLTVAANEAAGDGGIPVRQYMKPFNGDGPIGDPSKGLNGNFMRFRVNGEDRSLFGPWDSLLRAVVATAGGDPDYLLRTKASPTVALAWDLISGKTFTGENSRTPEALARNLLPFSLSNVGKGESLLNTAIGMTGLKASPTTPYEKRDQQLAADPAFNDPKDPQSLRKDPSKPATWDNLSPKGYQQAKDKYGIVDSRNPVVTANREAKQETEDNRLKEERDAAALHNQTHDGPAFRDQLNNIQRTAALEKSKTDSIFQAFKETGQLPADPNDRALTQFYDLYDKARLPGGDIDWDKFDTLNAQLHEGWTPAQAKYVDDQQGLATHDPAVQGFYDGRKKLDSSGFFDVKDDAWSFFVQQHPQLAEYKDYWDWRDKAQQWEYDQLIQQGVKPGVASQQAADNTSGLATATKFAEYSRTMFRHQWVVANPEQAVFAWEYGYFEPDKAEKAWLTDNGYTLAQQP